MQQQPGWSPEDSAKDAVAHAREELIAEYGDLVAGVLHYGAVNIDTKHLVVWLILSLPPNVLPAWCLYPDPPAGALIAPDLRTKLLDMQARVRSWFARHGWPEPDHVVVGFESDERVRAGGGWAYFR
jgi:hypothetical protein